MKGPHALAGGSEGYCAVEDSVEESRNSWLSEKIRQCGEIVGATVHNCERGWGSLVQVAQENDSHYRSVANMQEVERGE